MEKEMGQGRQEARVCSHSQVPVRALRCWPSAVCRLALPQQILERQGKLTCVPLNKAPLKEKPKA